MRTFVVTYTDGSAERFEADFAELVDDTWHLVRTVGRHGEERRHEIDAARVLNVSPQ